MTDALPALYLVVLCPGFGFTFLSATANPKNHPYMNLWVQWAQAHGNRTVKDGEKKRHLVSVQSSTVQFRLC